MTRGHWILGWDRRIVEVDLFTWAAWLDENSDGRRVAFDTVRGRFGEQDVSTVFIGIDLRFDDGPPLLFETMIFDGPLDGWTERSATWRDAERVHAIALAEARRARDNWREWLRLDWLEHLEFMQKTVAPIEVRQ